MREWWHDAVVYQICPRSFADSDGDGVGDLPGITARLGYLAELGVQAVWIWTSVFGGPAWTRISEPDGSPGQWYLHLYAPEQPDWNWRDPRTAPFFDDVVRFWFDRGVDGLRIDVAHGLFKADGLPDLNTTATVLPIRLRANPLACDREEVHEVYRRWRVLADGYSPPRALIGEVPLHLCRAALTLRRRLYTQRVLSADDAVVVDLHSPGALEVRRGETFTLVLAMGNTPVRLPAGRLLLASGPPTSDGPLPPDTTAWLRR